jgi:hypothetical protein
VIVIDRAKVKFLLAGRALTVEDRDPERYRRGRTYALGTSHRRSICRVEVLAVEAGQIKVRLARVDKPLLLARSSQYGYIEVDPYRLDDDLHRAMYDEPEAVAPPEVDRINARRVQLAAFQEMVADATDQLAVGATRVEQRKLRSIRYQSASLSL